MSFEKNVPSGKQKKETGRNSCFIKTKIKKVGLGIKNNSNMFTRNMYKTRNDKKTFIPERSFHSESLQKQKPEENVDELYENERINNLEKMEQIKINDDRINEQGSNNNQLDRLSSSKDILKMKQLRFCTPLNVQKYEEWEKYEAVLKDEEDQFTHLVLNHSNEIPCGNTVSCLNEFHPKPEEKQNQHTLNEMNFECSLEHEGKDWLSQNVKQKRVRSFNWSPLRHSEQIGRRLISGKDCGQTSECPQLSNHSQQGTKCDDSITIIKTNPTKGLTHESNERRLRNLKLMLQDKENISNSNKQKHKMDDYLLKPKPILIKKDLEKNSLLTKTDNGYENKSRFPLRTIQYFKNQRYINGKT